MYVGHPYFASSLPCQILSLVGKNVCLFTKSRNNVLVISLNKMNNFKSKVTYESPCDSDNDWTNSSGSSKYSDSER